MLRVEGGQGALRNRRGRLVVVRAVPDMDAALDAIEGTA
jgi:hypothetical protein